MLACRRGRRASDTTAVVAHAEHKLSQCFRWLLLLRRLLLRHSLLRQKRRRNGNELLAVDDDHLPCLQRQREWKRGGQPLRLWRRAGRHGDQGQAGRRARLKWREGRRCPEEGWSEWPPAAVAAVAISEERGDVGAQLGERRGLRLERAS